MQPEISIIVPVYNTEKYVFNCLESLVKQTYHNFEIIVVNDGSIDNSQGICEKLSEKDSRIKVFSKTNGGLSDARNFGIDKASGKYLGFVDSDDYLSEDMYEILIKGIKKNNADIAVAAIKQVDEDGKVLLIRGMETKCTVLNRQSAMEELLFSQRISNSVCNKLFKRELFTGIEFPVGKLYEDEFVTYKVFDKASKIYVSSKVFYNYRYNINSITHSEFSVREFDRIEASEQKIEFCKEKYPGLLHLAQKYLVYDCIMALSKMEIYCRSYDEIILKNIRKYIHVFMKGENSLKAKLFAIIAAINPKIAISVFKTIVYLERRQV